MLTKRRLRQLLSYDPNTGVFTRLRSSTRPDLVGRRSGWIAVNGYLYLTIDAKQYLGHRVAWLYMTGKWPRTELDHIDGNRANCRFANLRQASRLQNSWNSRKPSNNTSGFKGVSFFKRDVTWRSVIKIDGKFRHIGYFSTPEAAHHAYMECATKYRGQFARAS